MRSADISRSLAALAVLIACGDDPSGPGPGYDPELPAAWAPSITNPWFAPVAGSVKTFEAQTKAGLETIVVEVLPTTRAVNGVTAIVVRDRVYLDGELTEDTDDWYAEDSDGNVWYLGEDSKEIENGVVVSTAGSWEWGVDGALPGIMMWADPAAHIGEAYRQEYARGEAEDWGKVIATDESVTVPAGSFTGCIKTEDWDGLSSGREHKTYCHSVGVVLEVGKRGTGTRTELVSNVAP